MSKGLLAFVCIVLGAGLVASPGLAQTRKGNSAIGFNVDFSSSSSPTGTGTLYNFTGSGSLSQYIGRNLALNLTVGSAVTPAGSDDVNAVTSVGLGVEWDFTPRRATVLVPFVEFGLTANYVYTPPTIQYFPDGTYVRFGGLDVSNGFMVGGGFKAFVRENASVNTTYRLRSLSMEVNGSTQTVNSANISTGLQIYF